VTCRRPWATLARRDVRGGRLRAVAWQEPDVGGLGPQVSLARLSDMLSDAFGLWIIVGTQELTEHHVILVTQGAHRDHRGAIWAYLWALSGHDRRLMLPLCLFDFRPTSHLGLSWLGAVGELVGIDGGVVSGVINLESSGVEAVGLETTP
jgi:hypothetical protein